MPPPSRRPWVELTVLLKKDAMTVRYLAELTGLSESYLYDLRLGRRKPTPRVIASVAEAMNVPKSMLEPRAEAA